MRQGRILVNESLYLGKLQSGDVFFLEVVVKVLNAVDYTHEVRDSLEHVIGGCHFLPMGSSFLTLALACFSSLISRAWARRRRIESRDLACRELTTPPRFLAMILRVLCNEVGILAAVSCCDDEGIDIFLHHDAQNPRRWIENLW